MVYEANKTMQFLGNQKAMRIVTNKDMNEIMSVLNAHYEEQGGEWTEADMQLCLLHVFILGYIAGQRHERARKKKR